MHPLIHTILIILLTAKLTVLVATANTLHGLTVALLSGLLSYNLWLSYSWPVVKGTLLGFLLAVTITGIGQAITGTDNVILIISVLLTLTLAESIDNLYLGATYPQDSLALGTAILTPVIVLLWLAFFNTTPPVTQPLKPAGATPADRRFNRIMQAIGGADQTQVIHEMEARFGLTNTDTWTNGLGSNIPETGSWPIYIFFPDFPDDGSTLVQGIWGRQVDKLHLDSTAADALQPLLACRNATRAMFGNSQQYTPFFQVEDFGDASNPLGNLEEKIKKFAPTGSMIPTGCAYEKTAGMVNWVQTCLIANKFSDKYENDPDLQSIRIFGTTCGAVQFVGQ